MIDQIIASNELDIETTMRYDVPQKRVGTAPIFSAFHSMLFQCVSTNQSRDSLADLPHRPFT